MNECPKCGLITGVHSSTLPGCMCLLTPQRKECQRCGEVNPAEIHTCTPQRKEDNND